MSFFFRCGFQHFEQVYFITEQLMTLIDFDCLTFCRSFDPTLFIAERLPLNVSKKELTARIAKRLPTSAF